MKSLILEKARERFEKGRCAEAIAELNRALEYDDQSAEAYFLRGVCRYRLGHYQQVADDMDAAALLGCEVAQLWSRFGRREDGGVDAEEG